MVTLAIQDGIGHYTKYSYWRGWIIGMEIVKVGHSICLVKVQIVWVQTPDLPLVFLDASNQ